MDIGYAPGDGLRKERTMKKVVSFLFAMFLLGICLRPAFGDEIRVLAPAGGEYNVGSQVTIRWDYTVLGWTPGTAAEKRMRIDLFNSGSRGGPARGSGTQPTFDRTIAVVDVYSTQYSWTVADSPGDSRFIRITMLEKPFLTAGSVPFTIRKLMVAGPQAPYLLGIKITSPEAGKTYHIGDTVLIQWEKTIIQDNATVWIQVCWPDHATCGGGFPVANSGSYPWTINEPEEHDLCIKIRSHDDQHLGWSGVFHVKKKPFQAVHR